MIAQAVRKLLLDSDELAAMLKTDSGTFKIRPKVLSQSDQPALPAIVYHEIDSPSEEHLRGGAGMAHSRLQFDCHASSEIQARYIRELVRLRLQGFRGNVRVGTDDLFISGVTINGRRGEFDPPNDGTDAFDYIAQIDITFSHREPVGIG